MAKQSNDCWQRIKKMLEYADMSANYFAKHIGLMRRGIFVRSSAAITR